jgi:hypothetical protein
MNRRWVLGYLAHHPREMRANKDFPYHSIFSFYIVYCLCFMLPLEDSPAGAVITNALLSSPTFYLNKIKLERVRVLEKCPLRSGRSRAILDSTQAKRHAPKKIVVATCRNLRYCLAITTISSSMYCSDQSLASCGFAGIFPSPW